MSVAQRTMAGIAIDPASSRLIQQVRTVLAAHDAEQGVDAVLARMRSAAAGAPSVVVVGEVGRGKSSLVNALVEYPGLSPVGVGETTAAYLNVVPSSDQLPHGAARLEYLGGRTAPIEIADLARWITVGGGALQHDGEAPIGATVAVDSPLDGATVVDTPGAGGLDQNHALLAIAQAERASVLLLVTDTAAPISAPAVEFLAACAEHVAAIVVAVNKSDRSTDPAARVAETRTILADADARFADVEVVAVSAQNALVALETPDARIRDLARAASGIDELGDVLRRRIARADSLAVASALYALRRRLQTLDAKLAERAAASDHAGAVADELEQRQQRLEQLLQQKQYYRGDWSGAIDEVQLAFERSVEQRLAEFTERWQAQISTSRFGVKASTQQRLSVDIVADITREEAQLRAEVVARLTDVVSELYASAGLEPPDELDLTGGATASGGADDAAHDRATGLDVSMVLQGWAGYSMTAALLAPAAVTAPVLVPALPILGAAAMLALTTWGRQLQKRKSGLTEFVRTSSARVSKQLLREYRAAVSRIRSAVMKDFDVRLAARIAETKEEAQRARRLQAADDEARRDALTVVARARSEVAKVSRGIDEELARLLG